MGDVQVKWNNRSFYELRRHPDVVADLEARGRRVRDAANRTLREGQGYRMSSFQGRRKPQGRWFVQVFTASTHAKRSNAIRNTLLRVLDEAK